MLKFKLIAVGGYMWGECLVHMARDQERYSSILNRISGQIWDSAADITEIPVGRLSQFVAFIEKPFQFPIIFFKMRRCTKGIVSYQSGLTKCTQTLYDVRLIKFIAYIFINIISDYQLPYENIP